MQMVYHHTKHVAVTVNIYTRIKNPLSSRRNKGRLQFVWLSLGAFRIVAKSAYYPRNVHPSVCPHLSAGLSLKGFP